ncbi:protein argonaute-3 [Diorhabda sublineata]|uniref:protein argonaute-3 n=1 Tax=Diorhabda sublineata TaxID=1163346 RepID=UPI0024E0F7FE|nr:protein argonaute-3 [Diorhabda sublineata]
MDKVPPKGRGALLARIAQMQREKSEKQVGMELTADPPTKPKGRAALLHKLKEKKAATPGMNTIPQPETSALITTPGTKTVPQPETSALITTPLPESSISETEVKVDFITKATSEISFVEKEPVHFKGDSGRTVNLSVNYIKLHLQEDRGVFEYEVKFDPELDATNKRIRATNIVMKELNLPKVYDGGSILYLPQKITNTFKTFSINIPGADGDQAVEVKIIYKKQKSLSERECIPLYNVLFKRIMYILLYTPMGRNYFNTHHRYLIPQHKLEVLPGYVISVNELEGGLMLCLDTQHKVMRTQNAYELLKELRAADPKNFKQLATSSLIGSCIFTKYNNKTYTVEDIAWDMSPQDTFPTRDGNSISFIDYYKKQYDITITDLTQPLLINRKNVRVSGSAEKVEKIVCLVPEISYLTGLTTSMRNDFTVMKDIAHYTRVTPNQRVAALRKYLENVEKSPEAQQVLASWGLHLENDSLLMSGRQLDNEIIYFGNNQCKTNDNCDWSRAASDYQVSGPVDMNNWIVFFTDKDKKYANEFCELMCRLGKVMGCRIRQPQQIRLPDDRSETYVKICREHISRKTQIVVFICPNMRNDRYSIIKKICCSQIPVASQVINSRTLSNPQKVRSIVQKIALQMTCKLGGTLWTLRFPFKGWMICGVDVYHSRPEGTSVCGFVASLDESISRWFSVATFQEKELSDHMRIAFKKLLEAWSKENRCFPKNIVIIRDGVGDGQLDYCKQYEIEQIEQVLRELELDIKICFIIVQKRINTRVFSVNRDGNFGNPLPGTILDHSVTRSYLCDFFLVPQNVRYGTVNPTHYIVLYDSCNLKPDHIQRLCYKLCHLYYNWSGTIRVPAPCQYAHKLAALVGQHIKQLPSSTLADTLFYL